jgi:hypothetical protein
MTQKADKSVDEWGGAEMGRKEGIRESGREVDTRYARN